MKAARKAPKNPGNSRREGPGPRRDWYLALGLLAAVLLAYLPAWNGRPVWDDDAHLIAPAMQNWKGLKAIWFQPGATQQFYPLVFSVLWLEQKLWGYAVPGYHIVNILLHCGSALLLVKLLRRLEVPGAWLGAALWALHPVQVESVAWLSELKNTLSGLCYIGSALAYLRFDREKKGTFYLLSLGLFGAGLLAKTVIATLPAALLLVFWWKRKKLRWKEDILPLAPFFAVGIGLGLFTAWIERTMVMKMDLRMGEVGGHLSIMERLLVPGRAVWFYLGKLAWPHPLVFIYPRWQVNGAAWWQYLFPAALLMLAAGLWHWRRKVGTGPLVALLFFAGTLFPALGFLDIYPFRFSFVADHFQYLACLGPLALAGAGMERAMGWLGRQRPLLKPACCLALLAVSGAMSRAQSGQYAGAETLWRATLAENPGCWLAHNNLGSLLVEQGKIKEAMDHFDQALELNPDYAEPHENLANMLGQQGDVADAIAHYRKALALQADFAQAHNNLGILLAQKGDTEEAILQFREALDLRPDFRKTRENLSLILFRKGNADGAMRSFAGTNALATDPADRWHGLAKEFLQAGNVEEAIACYRQALAINPRLPDAWAELGLACFNHGQPREAVEAWQKSLDISPAQPQVLNNLASALTTATDPALHNGAKAVALAEQANQLTAGGNPIILSTLAAAYADGGRFAEAVATARQALAQAEARKDINLANALRDAIQRYSAGRQTGETK